MPPVVFNKLIDLCLDSLSGGLPSYLLPSSLPSLRRLALHSCNLYEYDSDSGTNNYEENLVYSSKDIVNLLPRLDFFSCDVYDDDPHPFGDDLFQIGHKTLFDFTSYWSTRHQASAIQHVRLATESPMVVSWDLRDIQKLCKRHPNLETVVIPNSKLLKYQEEYDAVVELLKKKEITVLTEDDQENREQADMKIISKVFGEYLRRRMAVANL